MAMSLNAYLDSLAHLNVGRVGSHERPHKPALLLAIISMFEASRTGGNQITYDPELFARFRKFFEIVRDENDAINMLDPYWRLRTDGLLEHEPRQGYEATVTTQKNAPSLAELQRMCSHSRLPEPLYKLLKEPESRERLRRVIIERYFSSRAEDIDRAVREEQGIGTYEKMLEADPDTGSQPAAEGDEQVRNQAFRRVVLRAYDYRCSACGLRVILDDLILVEAAHLMPFSISHDDDPRNGIALCRNHHWAMDRALIAPTARLTWQVSGYLDDRIEGQRDLLDLRGMDVIIPRLERFHPKPKSIEWREHHLL